MSTDDIRRLQPRTFACRKCKATTVIIGYDPLPKGWRSVVGRYATVFEYECPRCAGATKD